MASPEWGAIDVGNGDYHSLSQSEIRSGMASIRTKAMSKTNFARARLWRMDHPPRPELGLR